MQVYHRGVVYFIGCLYGLYSSQPRTASDKKGATGSDIEQTLTGKKDKISKGQYNYIRLALYLSIFIALTLIFHYYF